MKAYDTINEMLVNLFTEVWEAEEKAIITDEFKDITNNDMHIIEAIGLGDGNNMTRIANKLHITIGALSTSMNSLVQKDYVVRERSETDRRVVNIKLTQKGEAAFHHHQQYHIQLTEAVLNDLSEEEIPVLTNVLGKLTTFFREYK